MLHWFHLTRREAIVALILSLLIIGGWTAAYFLSGNCKTDFALSDGRVDSFLATLHQESHQQASATKMHPFDPNQCDSVELVSLGLKSWQAKAWIHYRESGFTYRSPEDIKRIYGITEQDYRRLKPYIRIARSDMRYAFSKSIPTEQQIAMRHLHDSLSLLAQRYRQMKLKKGETIDLQVADTTMLERIPGIGSYFARRIVWLRDELGGFVSLSQLDEISSLPRETRQWMRLGSTDVKQIHINTADLQTMKKHHYLTGRQALAIVKHRRKYGPLTSLQQLSTDSLFTPADLHRLRPYVTFK